jgi:hypothetical protein
MSAKSSWTSNHLTAGKVLATFFLLIECASLALIKLHLSTNLQALKAKGAIMEQIKSDLLDLYQQWTEIPNFFIFQSLATVRDELFHNMLKISGPGKAFQRSTLWRHFGE